MVKTELSSKDDSLSRNRHTRDDYSEKNGKIFDAWGFVYDVNEKLPNFYLTDNKGTFWVDRKGKLYKKNNALFVEHVMNHKLFKLKQKKPEGKKNMIITIEPVELDGDISVDDTELFWKTEVKNGQCEIVSKFYDFRLKFEAFCDVSGNEQLSCIGPNYRYINFLGKGGFANVYKGLNIKNEMDCAIKTARYNDNDPELEREHMFISKLRHENIIRSIGFKDVLGEHFLITEFAGGGSLEYRIKQGPEITEVFAKRIFKQLYSAFHYMHGKKILHRDLKPQNIVLTSTDDDTCIPKVIDFGLACFINEEEELKYIVGSYEYMAPEILSKKVLKGKDTYTTKTDVWGLGFCLFMTLNKVKPFSYSKDLKKYRYSMQQGKDNYSNIESYQNLSRSTKFVLDGCLTINMKKRPSVSQLMNYQWNVTPARQSSQYLHTHEQAGEVIST